MAARLRLLGAPELESRPPLRFLPERRFRLLAFLALRGDWVGRDELATLFWPDRPQDAARSNLRKLLLEVRTLGLERFESERDRIRWRIATDVADYQAALRRGDAEAALALYRGPALLGLDGGESEAFSAWLAAERERLRTTWRDLAVAAIPGRDPARALALATQLLDGDPYDEDAMVAVLGAHHALGERHAAAAAYRRCAERLFEELGIEPSARVRAAAAGGGGASVPAAAPAAEPAVSLAGSFIGRSGELAEIAALLARPECRLLTVTGPGGMGKSQLVKQAVRRLASGYADGAIWIALDDLSDVAQVAPRIATELKLELAPLQDPAERITAHLAKRQTLIALDNSEHLPRLATLIDRLIAAAPGVQIVSTSRTRIGVGAEWVLPLAGLALPPLDAPAGDAAAADAVQLFVAQARLSQPRFDARASLAHIAQLVRSVGGMPLAILLAAAWVRLLPMAELAQEVARSLDVLEGTEEGDERPEHRSVRATLEQSWRLLAPQEQRALAALSVMVGGFDATAAREVAQAPLPLVASLVDKSLLQSDGTGRFTLHPLIQQFAAEKLAADADAEGAARSAHCRYFDRWLRRVADVPRSGELGAMREIESALENLRAMWHHAIATRAWDTVAAGAVPLMRFFELRSRWDEGAALLDAADAVLADVPGDDSLPDAARANVWRAQSTLDYRSGAMERCLQRAGRSLALCRVLGIRKGIKGGLNIMGLAELHLNRRDDALRHFAAAIAEARSDGDIDGEAMFLGNASLVEKARGDFAQALAFCEQALAVHRVRNNQVSIQITLNNLGNLLRALQRPHDAVRVLNEALTTVGSSNRGGTKSFVLCNLSFAHTDLEDFTSALRFAERAMELQSERGEPALEASIGQAFARALIGLGRYEEARRHLARSVALAIAEHRTSVAVGTLTHWGCWHAARGESARAAALLRFVADHPATEGPDRAVAERALAALSRSLGTDAIAEADATARQMTIEQLAAELVATAPVG